MTGKDALEDFLRRALVLTIGMAMIFLLAPVQAQAADFDPDEILFPVEGDNYYSDTFGACRGTNCSRRHEGIDIMAKKGVPVVAPSDGVVAWVGSSCCYLQIDHGNGWATRYIHLNNDTQREDGTFTDDGLGEGIAEGIVPGAPVSAGQLIGWVGDSGNAEGTAPHVQFEIRRNGVPINAYLYLKAAEDRPLVYNGQFYDDDSSVFENDIEKIYAEGITKGCNPPNNTKYCVKDSVSRGAMAAFIRRTFELPVATQDYFSDDDSNIFEGDINAITEAGIGFGCGPDAFCPDQPLLREEFAEMFTRAFGYTNPDGIDWFIDDDSSAYETSINSLAVAGVTKGCNPPDNNRFCPDNPVDRGAMAAFFVRALGL